MGGEKKNFPTNQRPATAEKNISLGAGHVDYIAKSMWTALRIEFRCFSYNHC